MTGTEIRMVNLLYSRLGRIQSYDSLYDFLWGYDAGGGPNRPNVCLRTLMCKIKKQLRINKIPLQIQNFSTVGYMMIHANV